MLEIAIMLAQVGPAGHIYAPAKAVPTHVACVSDKNGFVNLRTNPSAKSPKVNRLNPGDGLFQLGYTQAKDGFTWLYVGTHRGRGWVRGDYACPLGQTFD